MKVSMRLDRYEYGRRVRDLHEAWEGHSPNLYDLAINQIVWLALNSRNSRVDW